MVEGPYLNKAEQSFAFTPHPEVGKRCGYIGYLRMDFGSSGLHFYSTFFDFRASRKTTQFKADLDYVINALREKDEFLHDLSSMQKFCWKHPEAELDARYRSGAYGVREDTEAYSFILRLWPQKGDYNLYCMCYKRTMLDRFLRAAEKGIPFVDGNGKRLFTLPDGERIKVTLPDGKTNAYTIRYLASGKFLYDTYCPEGKIFSPEGFAEYAASRGWSVQPEKN